VAVHVDDVYVAAAASTITAFNNIDHIEVLKDAQL
jgi:hypothetical protein